MDEKHADQTTETSQNRGMQPGVQGDMRPGNSMGNKMPWIVAGVALLLALGVGGYLWAQKGNDKAKVVSREIKIGLIGPFTGDAANYGEVMKHGAEMAQRDFNQEGLTIRLLERDTGCDAEKAAAAAEELVKEGVVAIIGEVCSGATLGALPIANENKVLLLSPSSSSPDLTIAGDFFYRTYPTDSYQGIVTTDLMYDKGIKKLAVMYSDEAYGKALAEKTVANFKELGGTVVTNTAFKTTDTEFKDKLNAAKAAGADALYIVTNGISAGAAIVVQAKQVGLDVPIYAADALKDSSFLADVGTSGEDMTLITVTPGDRTFLDEYKATYGSEPANATGAQSYDAFMALAQVVANGANTGEEIRQALPGVSFTGRSGMIKFDEYGDLEGGDYLIYTIKAGQFVLIEE